jgi:hypothetical protein
MRSSNPGDRLSCEDTLVEIGASQPFEAVFAEGTTGLVGTVEVAVVDNDGTVVLGPTTADITEVSVGGTPTGVYTWNAPAAPATVGQFSILWSPDGTWDPVSTSTADELVVVAASSGVLPPIPAPDDGGPSTGPATAWTTAAAVALCCSADVGTETSLFDDFVDEASQVLFELSGRRFYGLGTKTVRPYCQPHCGCGVQVLSRGHVVGGAGWGSLACNPSKVLLSGYPVRAISEVKIDGTVLAGTEYEVDDFMWARRKNNMRWPVHQNMTLDDTEEGTWSITYSYGQNPPLAGAAAAAQLACELYKACNAASGDGAECALPTGVTRIIRQGIVIERLAFTAWGRQAGIWRTGLTAVDEFLNAYNPTGMIRRPVFTSPASHLQYAPKLGA